MRHCNISMTQCNILMSGMPEMAVPGHARSSYLPGAGRKFEPETEAMTAMMLDDTPVRAVPSRGCPRPSVARLIAVRDVPPRRRVNAWLVGLDDAGIATGGSDRRALAEAGRGQFPL
jgi:hypothetical protein